MDPSAIGTIVWAVVVVVMCWIAPVVVGVVVAPRRGRSWALGLACGLFLSWLGVILLLLLAVPPSSADGGSRSDVRW